jgi:hypothetical protein
MSWSGPGGDRCEDPDGDRWEGPDADDWADAVGDLGEDLTRSWPLHWRELYPRERWLWFEQLWRDVCMLRDRYGLAIRSSWWENEIQLEALAALSAWVSRYDSGEWDDPPGKLALLYDLERVAALLRDGADPFNPDRDRAPFARYLVELGCEPSPAPGANGYEPHPDNHDEPPGRNGHSPPSDW